MQEIIVPAIYIVEDKIPVGPATDRRDRLLSKIKSDEIKVIKSQDLQNLIKNEGWYQKSRTGQRKGNPSIILSGFDWNDKFNDLEEINNSDFQPGKVRVADFRDGKVLKKAGIACNSGYELHVADGCLYACNYCHVGEALMVMLNLEEALPGIDRLLERRPEQKVVKCDNSTDILTLEPELGATKLLVEHFAGTDKYLLLFSKSDNVDHLLDLDHNKRTITGFTFSTDYCAKKFEPGTPSLDERITAAKKCQAAGYHLRIRFSPIIPVRNWKEYNKEMIRKTFENLNPEVISIEMLCHMDFETMNKCLDTPNLDPNFLANHKGRYELFSPDLRTEVYIFFSEEMRKQNSKVRRTLCLETPEVWNNVRNLNGNSRGFLCYCRGDKSPLVNIGKD
jgi:spore photoproduct lyase